MIRRKLLAIIVALGPFPGCGMAVRRADEETLAAATTVVRSFPEPSHRVALATFEAMRAELASAEFAKNSEFSPSRLVRKDGSKPKEGDVPSKFPDFWLEWKAAKGQPVRELVTLKGAHFAGKAQDGRPVEVEVVGQGLETLVTVRFDKLGDRMFSQWLLDRVANRLAHPSYPPGSIEEATAMKAFFGGVESREALPSLARKADATR
jgi:hypothetical protein